MEKVPPTQLELFELNEQSVPRGRGFSAGRHPQTPLVRGYQKAIINIVVVIFISLASYSLGVEKGKKSLESRASEANTQGPKAMAITDSSAAGTSSNIPLVQSRKETLSPIKVNARADSKINSQGQKEKEKSLTNNYTIQVASIAQSRNVAKELARLKAKGYSAFSRLKGKYAVICVGRFQIKEDAQNTLVKLRNSYPDCQLRRL